MDHWNNRDTAVVPELANVENCTVHFPDPKYADSHSDGANSVKALWDAIQTDNSYRPCAVLGPLEEKATLNLQSALAALDIPMLVHYVESDRAAAEASVSPETITMSLSALGRAKAMVQYLMSRGNLNIAGLRSTLQQETLLAETIEKIGEEMFNLNVTLFVDKKPAPDQDKDHYYRENLQRLKDNGVTTIFLTSIRDPYMLPQFAIYLEQLDMLTMDYFYVLPPSLVPPSFGNSTTNSLLEKIYGDLVPGSPMDKLLVSDCHQARKQVRFALL